MNLDFCIDKSDGRLEEIIEFAKRTNQEASFKKSLDILQRTVRNTYKDCKIWLFHDFAPMSLAFAIVKGEDRESFEREDMKYNGGIIYHGSHDGFGSGSMPTLSVCVEPTDGWSVHT